MEQSGQNPQHIAIIMDGNRRWARQHGMDPKLGHKEGAKTLENIVRYANKIGIPYLTVYAFSTENWRRAVDEVGALMLLLKNYLDDFSKKADTENIKFGQSPEAVIFRTPWEKKRSKKSISAVWRKPKKKKLPGRFSTLIQY